VPGDVELTIWLYPTAGEPFAITTSDFESEEEAAAALSEAFGKREPLRLRQHREGEGTSTLVINPVNLVAARVRSVEGADTGQYL
jgi:hypothetical protein